MRILKLINEAINDTSTYLSTHPRHYKEVETVLNHLKSAKKDIELEQMESESINWLIWFAPRYIYDGFGHKQTLEHIEKIRDELQRN